MKFAILEVAPHGHFTLVESLTQIFSVDPLNTVTIFTNARGKKFCSYLESKQVKIITPKENESLNEFFQKIKNYDHLFAVTFEPVSKQAYRINRAFLSTEFSGTIHFLVHNVDIWFGNSFFKRLQNIAQYSKNLSSLWFQIKLRFFYNRINGKIIEKVKQSSGKIVVLSEPIKKEMAQFIDKKWIEVLPFSLFDENLTDTSFENKKLRVCLPGAVSSTRRDYVTILRLLLDDTTHFFKENVEWDFLGRIFIEEGGKEIESLAKQAIAAGHDIHLYGEAFIPFDFYHEQLEKADVMLGNLHLQLSATSFYGKSKESGIIFTMIKAAKPGILLEDYDVGEAMQSAIIRFNTYEEAFEQLKSLRFDPLKLIQFKQNALTDARMYAPARIFATWLQNQ